MASDSDNLVSHIPRQEMQGFFPGGSWEGYPRTPFVRDQTEWPLAHWLINHPAMMTVVPPARALCTRNSEMIKTHYSPVKLTWTETMITKAVDKAQMKRILFFFLRRSGISHRSDMQRRKK